MGFFTDVDHFFDNVWDRLRGEHSNRRREEEESPVRFPIFKPDPEPDEVDQPIVDPLAVNVLTFYEDDNAKEHHTDKYELVTDPQNSSLILRRGQPFYMTISFKGRNFDSTVDNLKIIFNFGRNPNPAKTTSVILEVTDSEEFSEPLEEWDVKLHGRDDTSITLYVQIACDAMVGLWGCHIVSSLLSHPYNIARHVARKDIYILFNPWCEEDTVYMEDEEQRDECILNDVGKVWIGPHRSARGRPWVFGQFDDSVFLASIFILDRSFLAPSKRGDPVQVSRVISRMVNSNDDNGIIMGNWSGDYADGTPPTKWTGSVRIMEKYLSTGRSVKYGQCWVFAAITNSVCRALGLPCRVVSNLVSAHDTNTTLSIDYYFDENGEKIENPDTVNSPTYYGNDSVWNFHVWNEVWMGRPDLPSGYGGWQAIDATPQEQSDGMMQCGPASLEAIRRGEVWMPYDVTFVFAEVNADIIHWKRDNTAKIGYRRIGLNNYHVGRQIMTKAPGFAADDDTDGLDVKDLYKNREGTRAERAVLLNAVRKANVRAKRFHRVPTTDDLFDMKFDLVDIEEVNIGNPFFIIVNMENIGSSVRKVTANLSADSVYYNGVKAYKIKDAQGIFMLQPHSKETLKLQVSPREYMDKLVEHCHIKIYALAVVDATKQAWHEEDDFQIVKPRLQVMVHGEGEVGRPVRVHFSFTNPLKQELTNCSITFEGPGLARPKTIKFRNIAREEKMSYSTELVPKRSGMRKIVATFTSKELVDITGMTSITVN